MGVLRCTAKYRKLFGLPHELEEPALPMSGLGAWYANTLNIGYGRYLHICRRRRGSRSSCSFAPAIRSSDVSLRRWQNYSSTSKQTRVVPTGK